jgi:hypothetical protein
LQIVYFNFKIILLGYCLLFGLFFNINLMAGHSKWHNIKHRKAAQDAKKAKIYAKLAKFIQLEATK